MHRYQGGAAREWGAEGKGGRIDVVLKGSA